jgi:hypothetical protein
MVKKVAAYERLREREVESMRRIVFVLALMAVMLTVVFGSSALTQEVPPDQGGGPETGCEGIQNANLVQGEQAEPSKVDEVGKAHSCKTDLPFNPYNPGSSGGQ